MCREELNFQSYSDHIKAIHPEEDPRDRREFGQAKLFGGVVVKKVTSQETSQEHDKSIEDAGPSRSQSNEEVHDDVSMEEAVGPVNISDENEETVGDENEEVIEDVNEEVSMVEIKQVKDTIQNILENEGVEVNYSDCTTEEQQLNKCLLLVSKRLKVKKEATNLVSMLEDLKLAIVPYMV